MRPTVGRSVHFYGGDLRWHYMCPPEFKPQPMKPETKSAFHGPFAATIVYVHPNGRLNLSVFYPSPCMGHDQANQVVENVKMLSGTQTEPGENLWCWPPYEGP